MLIDSASAATSEKLTLTTLEPYLGVVKAYCGLLNCTEITARRFRSHELEGEADPILWTKKGHSLATLCRASLIGNFPVLLSSRHAFWYRQRAE